jgi:hypothetical protein
LLWWEATALLRIHEEKDHLKQKVLDHQDMTVLMVVSGADDVEGLECLIGGGFSLTTFWKNVVLGSFLFHFKSSKVGTEVVALWWSYGEFKAMFPLRWHSFLFPLKFVEFETISPGE